MKNELILANGIDLYQIKEDFISYLDVSTQTLNTYEKGIKSFFEYLISNNIKNPTRNDLRGFRETLKETLTNNTINSYLTAVRRFFNYLALNGVYQDITIGVKNVKVSNIPKKQVLTEEEVKDIYNQLTDKREKVLWGLSITTGLRGIEMANAKLEHIKVHNGEVVLWVKCKGHQDYDEYVKLPAQVLNDILEYVSDRTNGYIFTSKSNRNIGCGITTKTLRLEIKNIFKRFGLNEDTLSLHSTRRTSATIAYNSGSDIKEIQQMLHHRSIATTQRYINQSTRDNNKTEYNIANVVFS